MSKTWDTRYVNLAVGQGTFAPKRWLGDLENNCRTWGKLCEPGDHLRSYYQRFIEDSSPKRWEAARALVGDGIMICNPATDKIFFKIGMFVLIIVNLWFQFAFRVWHLQHAELQAAQLPAEEEGGAIDNVGQTEAGDEAQEEEEAQEKSRENNCVITLT